MFPFYYTLKLCRFLPSIILFLLFLAASVQSQTLLKVKILDANDQAVPNVTVIGPKAQYKLGTGTSTIDLGRTNAKLPDIIDNLKFVKSGWQTVNVEYFDKENELLVLLEKAPDNEIGPAVTKQSKKLDEVNTTVAGKENASHDLELRFESVTNQVRSEQKILEEANAAILIEIKNILKRLETEKTFTPQEKKKLRLNLQRLTKVLYQGDKTYNQNKGQRDELLERLSTLLLEKDSINKLNQMKILKLEKEKQLEKESSTKHILYVTFIALCLSVVVVLLAFLIRKVINQKSTLELQNIEISEQKEKAQAVYKELSDSIVSAKVIQNAILPGKELMRQILPNVSVFFQPKNVVSGDFYWCYQDGHKTMLAAVDCTGHGVAGAFMSFLGYEIINEIVRNNNNLDAGQILSQLNAKVLKALNTYGSTGVNSGMDISLCILDYNKSTMEFAGANNSLYVLRKGMTEVEQIIADRQGIGGRQKALDFKFKTHSIPFSKDDSFMIFTDGYADQIGDEGRKFMYPQLRQLFVSIASQEPEVRDQVLETQFKSWKGSEEQLDDVLVICFTV
ncbi:MAG: SpoIIE family protein phosphatase [Opitutaceae bacterium]|nr:SpoIIE family protein phosphatase [Cytophagales bacterium]